MSNEQNIKGFNFTEKECIECLVCLEEKAKLHKCDRCNAIICIECYKNIKIRSCLVCKLEIFNKKLNTKFPIKDTILEDKLFDLEELKDRSRIEKFNLIKHDLKGTIDYIMHDKLGESFNCNFMIFPDNVLVRKCGRNGDFIPFQMYLEVDLSALGIPPSPKIPLWKRPSEEYENKLAKKGLKVVNVNASVFSGIATIDKMTKEEIYKYKQKGNKIEAQKEKSHKQNKSSLKKSENAKLRVKSQNKVDIKKEIKKFNKHDSYQFKNMRR